MKKRTIVMLAIVIVVSIIMGTLVFIAVGKLIGNITSNDEARIKEITDVSILKQRFENIGEVRVLL